MLDLIRTMDSFAFDNSVFTSEADFQMHFGMRLCEIYGNEAKIALEVPIRDSYTKRCIRVDVVLKLNGQYIPIELKYRTKTAKVVDLLGNEFYLKSHKAYDAARYGFAQDICRISNCVKSLSGAMHGYCIFATNDEYYFDNNANFKSKKTDYRLESIVSGSWEWKVDGHDRHIEIPEFEFVFDGWRNMSGNGNGTQFKYKIAEIKSFNN